MRKYKVEESFVSYLEILRDLTREAIPKFEGFEREEARLEAQADLIDGILETVQIEK